MHKTVKCVSYFGRVNTVVMRQMIFNSVSGELAETKKLLRHNMCELQNSLRALIEADSGFVDVLFNKKVISYEHTVDTLNSLYSRNDKLLDFLLFRYKGDYREILEALTETAQQHVVNFITSGGGTFHAFSANFISLSINLSIFSSSLKPELHLKGSSC